ncbi:MAG: chorismate mutase [Nitrososphaerota archaeon]|nr:chorismate mutase [Nitrososphaerota archaeon]
MEDLQVLRKQIDEIDQHILKALSERVTVCQKIGKYKKQNCLPIQDHDREKEVFCKVKAAAVEFDLDSTQIERLFREIINICSDIQK